MPNLKTCPLSALDPCRLSADPRRSAWHTDDPRLYSGSGVPATLYRIPSLALTSSIGMVLPLLRRSERCFINFLF